MADLFHLFSYNIVAGDVGDIPGIPNKAANGEHGVPGAMSAKFTVSYKWLRE